MSNKLQHTKGIIIAIDGHSSCGKSTLARNMAKELKYIYIDSGAMYRAITLFAIENNLIGNDFFKSDDLVSIINKVDISFGEDDAQRLITYLNGINVEDKIRSLQVSQFVSKVSAIPKVRAYLVALQRKLAEKGGVVMDGRDIGTIVFPNAQLKIFLTATAEIRAQRRYKELIEKGDNVSFDEVYKNVVTRDKIDSTRSESPLRQANDALLLDNSELSSEETLQKAMKMACMVLKSLNKQNDAC